MSASTTRTNAIISHTGVNFSGKEGYLLKENSGALAVNDSTSAAARAVVINGEVAANDSTVGILGALSGTVRLKLSGTVTKYALLQQASDGTVVTDAGTGSRVLVGVALEGGVSGDLIEVATLAPRLAS